MGVDIRRKNKKMLPKHIQNIYERKHDNYDYTTLVGLVVELVGVDHHGHGILIAPSCFQ